MNDSYNLNDWIKHHAHEQPDKVFLIDTVSKEELTYGGLLEGCFLLENYFQEKLEIPRQGKIAFLMENGLWSTLIFLAIMHSNRVVLPINGVSGNAQIAYVLKHSGVKVLIVSPTYKEKIKSILKDLKNKLKIIVCDEHHGSNQLPKLSRKVEVHHRKSRFSLDNTAILIYTSGTTGNPKGVLLSHKNVIAGAKYTIEAHQLKKEDRVMCVLPLYHINGEIVTVITPLVSGGSLIMPPKFSVSRFWFDVLHYQCTWINLVPTIISYLIAAECSIENLRDKVKRQVQFARSASAPLSESVHKAFEKKFSIKIVETMGLSETAAPILSNKMDHSKYGSPGIAVGNQAKLVDLTSGEEIKENGRKGEIWVKGDNVMKGYYRNLKETQKTIVSGGWLRTGDLATKDEDGFYFIKGRLKEIIIKGGENISPREIDDVLYSHPAVLEAAAIGVRDPHYGFEIYACVVLKKDHRGVDAKKLKQFCQKHLGDFKSPRFIKFLDSLPKGASGKIQRLKIEWRSEWNS